MAVMNSAISLPHRRSRMANELDGVDTFAVFSLTSTQFEIIKKLRCRADTAYQQVVARTGASDV